VKVTLRDGSQVVIREVRPSDKALIAAGHDRLSDDSKYRRFLGPKPHLTSSELRYLTEIDGWNHVALLAVPADDPDVEVGVARFIRDAREPAKAEFAIVVADDHQGLGLGRDLAVALADAALERGVRSFTATVSSDNAAVQRTLATVSERMTVGAHVAGTRELRAELLAA
jgi:acetyltransferase